jgi:hypothetical protein
MRDLVEQSAPHRGRSRRERVAGVATLAAIRICGVSPVFVAEVFVHVLIAVVVETITTFSRHSRILVVLFDRK